MRKESAFVTTLGNGIRGKRLHEHRSLQEEGLLQERWQEWGGEGVDRGEVRNGAAKVFETRLRKALEARPQP